VFHRFVFLHNEILPLLHFLRHRLKALYSEEGEIGRRKFTQYSRLLTVPLAVIQGLSLLVVLERQGIIEQLDMFARVTNLSVVVAGSLLLMWLGELVSEYGIGNGVSVLIFAGIVANVPREISQALFTYDKSSQRRDIKDNDLPIAEEMLEDYKQSILTSKKFGTKKSIKYQIVPKDDVKNNPENYLLVKKYSEIETPETKHEILPLGDLIIEKKERAKNNKK
jgi:hypothetical protein